MLDQNTDRMWYVIGAVIVGAALIFLVNSSFPQLFASVGNTFKDKTEEVSQEINDINNENILDFEKYPILRNHYMNVETGENVLNETGWWNSMISDVPVKPNQKYVFMAPEGLVSPRIAYYDKSGVLLKYSHNTSSKLYVDHAYYYGSVVTVAPERAAFVRLAAGDTSLLTTTSASPMSEWQFYASWTGSTHFLKK